MARPKTAARAAADPAVSTAPPGGPFNTIEAAAAYFHVSEYTVRRWIKIGVLPAYKLGPRLVRVRMDEVAALARPFVVVGGSDDA